MIHHVPPTIAVKYHLYWAGSDQDGAVAGFYWAVVETLPIAPPELPGLPPPLPGPKPQDYRFTPRTDSVFVFRASEFASDRQHAFYIYAVDNQGKADPTPARIIFNALDNYPPLPVIEELRATGTIFRLGPGGQLDSATKVVFVTDTLPVRSVKPPQDTIPLNARIDIRWRGEPVAAGTYVAGYQYKLDETQFNVVDSSVHTASYNTGVAGDKVRPGLKIFTLRAFGQSGWVRETHRRFQMNYMPDTWFAGPDSAAFPLDLSTGDRFLVMRTWPRVLSGHLDTPADPPIPSGTLLSCDSITTWPAERPEMKTFFEIYKDRLYVRSELDTVHMNSIVILHNGGLDPDSPFDVKVNANDPEYPDTVACFPAKMLRPSPPNGSPVGFRMLITTLKDLNDQDGIGPYDVPAQSGLYPIFDAGSVFRSPVVGSYQPMRNSGVIYAVGRSEDGNAVQDRRVLNPRDDWEAVAANRGDARQRYVYNRIIKFYVNKAPYLKTTDPRFRPQPNDSFPTRSNILLNLPADDEDPLDPEITPPPPSGGPGKRGDGTISVVLRWNLKLRNDSLVYQPLPSPVFDSQIQIDIPRDFPGTRAILEVELCDCSSCEITPGQGRCVKYNFPIRFPPPTAVYQSSPESLTRPGPSFGGKRSKSP